MTTYSGPIIDGHIHLWRYDVYAYPWLAAPGHETLRRDVTAEDFVAKSRPTGVTASVHVQAGRRAQECIEETRWLSDLDPPAGAADRWVVHVPLEQALASALLEEQASFERVVGVRDILSWHPDPAKSFLDTATRMEEPEWRANFARLADHNLAFDMLISPYQAEAAARLATEHPGITIAINHCGSPFDRDAGGMARWREGLKMLAATPNTVIKISDPVAYDPDWSEESLGGVIRECIETFGPARAMYASDDPVMGFHIDYARWVEVFRGAVAGYSEDEQADLFHGTAARTYRF